jgi:hypothetical protein
MHEVGQGRSSATEDLTVKSVYATVRQPKDATDTGQVTIGFYTLADGVLTMTDSKGAAVRERQSGETYTHKMQPGEDAEVIAKRLTLEIYRMLRGETAAPATGFGRALNYPAGGVA